MSAYAKALAVSRGLPLAPVNHLHGHVASLYLAAAPARAAVHLPARQRRPHAAARGRGARLGAGRAGSARTLDDAAGEAFDKGARLLGLPYPGGAEIDRLARDGDPDAYRFPVARVPGLDFSFSGLKTALLYAVRALPRRSSSAAAPTSPRATSARSCARSSSASRRPAAERVAIVGGVAANSELRAALPGAIAAPLALCTDNARDDRLRRPLHAASARTSTLRSMRLRARPELGSSLSRRSPSRALLTVRVAAQRAAGSAAVLAPAGGRARRRPPPARLARPADDRRAADALGRAAPRAAAASASEGRSGPGAREDYAAAAAGADRARPPRPRCPRPTTASRASSTASRRRSTRARSPARARPGGRRRLPGARAFPASLRPRARPPGRQPRPRRRSTCPASTAPASRSRCSTPVSTARSTTSAAACSPGSTSLAAPAQAHAARDPATAHSPSFTARELAGRSSGAGGPGGLEGVAPGATVLPIRSPAGSRTGFGGEALYARSDQVIAGLERAVDPSGAGDVHRRPGSR